MFVLNQFIQSSSFSIIPSSIVPIFMLSIKRERQTIRREQKEKNTLCDLTIV